MRGGIRGALQLVATLVVLATGPGRLLWMMAHERDRETERRRTERERLQPVPPRTQEHRHG